MTYIQVVGNTADSAAAGTVDYTMIDLNTTANATTVLTKAFAYCNGSGTSVKIKIFRDDGTNYNFIGEISFTGQSGLNEVSCDLSIQSNDLIGLYNTNASTKIVYDGSAGSLIYKSGDITINTLKSAWASTTGTAKLNAGYNDAEYYVKTTGNDVSNGQSWTNAWSTINKAATTIADGSTVHIGFGTYNAEPAGNKIAPQNAGSSGIKYLCETATTGGGTGSVIVEKN